MKGPIASAVDVRLEFAERAKQIAHNNNESLASKQGSPREVVVKKTGSPKTGSPTNA